MKIRSLYWQGTLSAFFLVVLIAPVPAQKRSDKSVRVKQSDSQRPTLWRDPGDIESLDFNSGPGGSSDVPQPPFTFIEEDKGGTNPKIKVSDAVGREWGVKWGEEIHSEVFSSRLVWAVGYTVEASYLVKSGRILGAKNLGRARKYVSDDGHFTSARFELKDKTVAKKKDRQSWSWRDNPFVGTRELNGLRIMIMLTSNWDPKDKTDTESNTAIYINKKTGEVVYLVTDWGATMGKWGGVFSREKWDCDGYADQTHKFVSGIKGGVVHFGYEGKHANDMRDGIRVSDARWLMSYLGRVSDAQIHEGLIAAGATSDEAGCFGRALRARINELKRVSGF